MSVQPFAFKRNVVHNLARRIIGLSDSQFHREVINYGKKMLVENCYPSSFVSRIFKKVQHEVTMERINVESVKKNIDLSKIVKLPYVPLLSENLAVVLDHYGYTVINCNFNNLEFLFSKLKAKRDNLQLSEVVYKIQCKDCEIAYIGQTRQILGKRLNGHKYDQNEKTALHQHQNELQHNFDFENVKVLARETNDFSRSLIEMICIVKERDMVCNYRADVDKLGVAYHHFFQPRPLE